MDQKQSETPNPKPPTSSLHQPHDIHQISEPPFVCSVFTLFALMFGVLGALQFDSGLLAASQMLRFRISQKEQLRTPFCHAMSNDVC